MKTFEQLIGVFYDNALKSFIIDYNNKNSIRRTNNNVDKYRKAAKTIGLLYPELIENYINILCHERKRKDERTIPLPAESIKAIHFRKEISEWP